MTQQPDYHSGMAAVLGRSNAGKSTLLNALVGHKVAIVSDRVQTTRSRLMGVMHRPGSQVIFIDTPGMHTARTRLGEYMVKQAWGALDGVDCGLLVVDATCGFEELEQQLYQRMKASKFPLVCAVNKTDLIPQAQLATLLAALPPFEAVYPISALTGEGLDALAACLTGLMPPGPAYFPQDMYTDQPERRMAAELIREAALHRLRDEVPHGIGVEITAIHQPQNPTPDQLTRVEATVYVERQAHKPIIIGHKGSMLQQIGTAARQQLQTLFGTRVHLQLFVKVRPNWRDSNAALKDLEYTND